MKPIVIPKEVGTVLNTAVGGFFKLCTTGLIMAGLFGTTIKIGPLEIHGPRNIIKSLLPTEKYGKTDIRPEHIDWSKWANRKQEEEEETEE